MRAIIVVLDGLRPDCVTEDDMPELAALSREGVRFGQACSVFPSETRVATSSLLTGCRPGAHGLVGNTMFVPSVLPDRLLRTNRPSDLALLGSGGSPLERPTLGEYLAGAGRSLAVVSAGTGGSAVLTHPLAGRLGAFRWNAHDTEGDTADRVQAAFGPTPPAGKPNVARIGFAASVLTELVLPTVRPDIALLWSSEPDISFHQFGVGSDAARTAVQAADRAVGRVRAWRDAQPDRDAIGIVVLSDHGHVTGATRIDVVAELRRGGFSVGEGFGDGADLVVAASASPGIWLRTPDLAPPVAAFLAAQEWAGPVLTRDPGLLPGATPLAQLGSGHARSPDLVLLFAGSDGPDGRGMPGHAPYDAGDVPVGGGMHGGLHRRELATVMVMAGGPFRRGAVIETPADLTDVTPTLLHLLELPPGQAEGRVLNEAWDAAAPPQWYASVLDLGRGFVLEAAHLTETGRLYPTGLRRA